MDVLLGGARAGKSRLAVVGIVGGIAISSVCLGTDVAVAVAVVLVAWA